MRPALASTLFATTALAIAVVAACGDSGETSSGSGGAGSTTASSGTNGTGGEIFPSVVATGVGGGTSSTGSGTGGSGGSPTCTGTPSSGSHILSENFEGAGNQTPLAIALDASGNIGLVGAVQGSMKIGANTLTSAGLTDIFISKLDSNGVAIWAKQFGNSTDQVARSVTFDAAGNMIVGSVFRGTLSVGGGSFTSNKCCFFDDIVFAKYDPQGNHIWSKSFGDSNAENPRSLKVAPNGDIIMAGEYQTKIDFGGGVSITAADAMTYDGFVTAFDAQGNAKWAKSFGGSADQIVTSAAVDANGNIIVTGWTQGDIDFGQGPLMLQGTENLILAKLDSAGNVLWGKIFGAQKARGTSVAVDGAGNIYVTGNHQGILGFGGAALNNKLGENVFVAKLDPQGAHIWSRTFGDDAAQSASSIVVDKSNNIFVAGDFNGSMDFGSGPIMTGGDFDAYVAKLDSDGCGIWAKSFGAPGLQSSRALAVDPMGQVLVTGTINGTVNFGGGPLTSQADDVFLAKFAP